MSGIRQHAAAARATVTLDVQALRAEFPILARQVRGRPLVYLDNAATTQKPRAVLDALDAYYTRFCSNVYRSVHELSARATEAFEGSRTRIQQFLGAADRREVVFTHGTTEGINLVAHAFGAARVRAGDEILVSEMEHHSNIVPWQLLCERTGALLRVAPIDERGELVLDELERRLTARTRLVALAHTSNSLGTRNPVARVAEMAHARGAVLLVDGAQAVAHERVDVQSLNCDFFAFSGHKLYGPTGIGVLWGRAELLEQLPPFLGGGEMIRSVSFAGTTFKSLPQRFEAGTPNIAGAIGLGAAVEFLERVGLERVGPAERQLSRHLHERLAAIPGVRILGTARDKAPIASFVVDGIHPHDLGTALDAEGIAVRAGHHCAQPVMERFGVPATVRASIALYNTAAEVDALVDALERGIRIFR